MTVAAGISASVCRLYPVPLVYRPESIGRWCEGLKGFDFAHRIKGSVPVQARDHRKRRCNQLSADSNQRDYALAA